ncbi:MAG: response regulator transcription factor [bacterium]|nr:response regulator transcription factor [bacterium]
MHYNCLVVDDELELAESTSEYFNLFDVKTGFVTDYEECIKFLQDNTTDLILLDINLHKSSGFELCKQIRQEYDMPILFISARDQDEDVLIAFGIGGDDYIHKPYSLQILLAKVKAVLQRLKKQSVSEEDKYESKDLTINYMTGKVYVRGEEVLLKAMEYKLLTYLIQKKGCIISKEELFEQVWADSFTGDSTLNVHIRHLRERIEENPNHPVHIKTIWGRGYCYEE